jgi:hypothetical protein
MIRFLPVYYRSSLFLGDWWMLAVAVEADGVVRGIVPRPSVPDANCIGSAELALDLALKLEDLRGMSAGRALRRWVQGQGLALVVGEPVTAAATNIDDAMLAAAAAFAPPLARILGAPGADTGAGGPAPGRTSTARIWFDNRPWGRHVRWNFRPQKFLMHDPWFADHDLPAIPAFVNGTAKVLLLDPVVVSRGGKSRIQQAAARVADYALAREKYWHGKYPLEIGVVLFGNNPERNDETAEIFRARLDARRRDGVYNLVAADGEARLRDAVHGAAEGIPA